jgi:hypothetical protein
MSVSVASSAEPTPEYTHDDDHTRTARDHLARGHIVRQRLKLAPPPAIRARRGTTVLTARLFMRDILLPFFKAKLEAYM